MGWGESLARARVSKSGSKGGRGEQCCTFIGCSVAHLSSARENKSVIMDVDIICRHMLQIPSKAVHTVYLTLNISEGTPLSQGRVITEMWAGP